MVVVALMASLSVALLFLGLWVHRAGRRMNPIEAELAGRRQALAVPLDAASSGFAALAEALLGGPYIRFLDQKLAWAGQPGEWTGARVAAAQVGGALGAFFLLGPLFALALGPAGLLAGTLGAVMGFFFPRAWLDRKAEERQKAINNALPAYMNLVALGVQAGLPLPEAMRRVAQRLDGPLAEESMRTVQEMAAASRSVALNNWAQRTGVTGVARLSWILHQAERYGTPIADVLRDFAQDLRRERLMAMQAAANALSVKIIFPLMVFGLGPILALLMIPVFMSMKGAFAF